jgi:hypothetical protein
MDTRMDMIPTKQNGAKQISNDSMKDTIQSEGENIPETTCTLVTSLSLFGLISSTRSNHNMLVYE